MNCDWPHVLVLYLSGVDIVPPYLYYILQDRPQVHVVCMQSTCSGGKGGDQECIRIGRGSLWLSAGSNDTAFTRLRMRK